MVIIVVQPNCQCVVLSQSDNSKLGTLNDDDTPDASVVNHVAGIL